VQTQHSVLKRGGLYWDREALPPSLYEDHLKQVQAAIAEAGDDAWIMYGDAQRYGAVAYTSHFLPRARSAIVLVPRSGEPTLLASVGARDVPAGVVRATQSELLRDGALSTHTQAGALRGDPASS
jgi:Xaa-Pro aminopeptidase